MKLVLIIKRINGKTVIKVGDIDTTKDESNKRYLAF